MSPTELSSYEIVSIGRKFAKNKKYGPSTTLVSVCEETGAILMPMNAEDFCAMLTAFMDNHDDCEKGVE